MKTVTGILIDKHEDAIGVMKYEDGTYVTHCFQCGGHAVKNVKNDSFGTMSPDQFLKFIPMSEILCKEGSK